MTPVTFKLTEKLIARNLYTPVKYPDPTPVSPVPRGPAYLDKM